jgi:hypothetical protein
MEDRKIDGLCDQCGRVLMDGQVCCKIEPADGHECRCGYRLPFHCGHCGLPFPTLNDYRQIDGHRLCVDCADMLRR